MAVATQDNAWKYPFDIPAELQQQLRLVVAKNNITIQEVITRGLKHTLTQYHANGTNKRAAKRKAEKKSPRQKRPNT